MIRRKAIRRLIWDLERKAEYMEKDLTLARKTYPDNGYEARFKEIFAEIRGAIMAFKIVGQFK